MENEAHGRFHWNELLTDDIAAAQAFYGPIMKWEFDRMAGPDGAYLIAIKNNLPVAGIVPRPAALQGEASAMWLGYIEIDDIDSAVQTARASGATVLRAPYDVPEVGRIAILRDPVGAVVGWVTPDFDD